MQPQEAWSWERCTQRVTQVLGVTPRDDVLASVHDLAKHDCRAFYLLSIYHFH